jgi:hypothetical protein
MCATIFRSVSTPNRSETNLNRAFARDSKIYRLK